MKKEIVIILHNVRSAHNVGAMFRTAEAAGVSRVYLSGYTPAPFDRFGRERKDIAKSALGAEKMIDWEAKKSLSALISKLKKEGFYMVAIEQSPKSINYRQAKARKKTALIVGNEVSGLSPAILKRCDIIAEIPMRGRKESLNVSVALGIVLFEIIS